MTHDLKTSLDDLAEAEFADAPHSTIDIGRARADGRRRILASRLAPIGGGVAVVAACALVVNGLGGASPAKPQAGTSAAAGHDFTGTDPLTAVAAFGYLPDGFQTAGHSVGPVYGNSVTARTKPLPWGHGTEPAILSLGQSGGELWLQKYETKIAVTVAGSQKAYLITNPADLPTEPSELTLEWQTASGSWLSLAAQNQTMPDAAMKAQLLKVADSVTAADAAVALPLHVEGMPKDAVLAQVTLESPIEVGQGGVSVGLSYYSGTATPDSASFTITAISAGFSDGQVDPLTGLVSNSAPAASVPGAKPAPSTDNACKDAGGLHICVQESPGKTGVNPLASVGGVQGLLNHITSLGTNPANWTTHVVN